MNSPNDQRYDAWFALLRDRPDTALSSLLNGTADISPFNRLEPSDALRLMCGHRPPSAEERELLSEAILRWLERTRSNGTFNAQPQRQDTIRQICNAFQIVSHFALEDAAKALHSDIPVWQKWLSDFRMGSTRDALESYRQTLKQTEQLGWQRSAKL